MKIFLSPVEYKELGLGSYNFEILQQDYYRNEIIDVLSKRMPPIEPKIEFDFISIRLKRLLLEHDDRDNAEMMFLDSLSPSENTLDFFCDYK